MQMVPYSYGLVYGIDRRYRSNSIVSLKVVKSIKLNRTLM